MSRDIDIPLAAIQRLQELENEREAIASGVAQVGTSVPRLFYQADTFITNPSNVGTGILSRMIETDDTVSSAVQLKILMTLAKIGEYHHDNQEIADFVNRYLNQMRGPTWQEAMESILSACAYGFSVSEIVFGINKNLQKVPVKLPTYHPSTIAFEVDAWGNITENGIIQYILQQTQNSNPNTRNQAISYGFRVKNPFQTPTDRLTPYRLPFFYQYGLARIPRKKVIHYVNLPMLSFGNPYGRTAVRTAHLCWQLKQFFLKQIGIAGKRQSTPFLHGQAPHSQLKVEVTLADGSKKEVSPAEAMRLMLRDREGDDAIVTGPEKDGYGITVLNADANLNQMLDVIRELDVRIFRCFLLPSLVLTDGSAGSRSLGDRHFEIVDKIAETDAIKFGDTIVNDMIERTIIENFGAQENYGSFTQRPQSIDERERLSSMFQTLVTTGVMKPHVEEDMAYIRKTLSLPKDMDKGFKIDVNETPDGEVDEDKRGNSKS